MSYFSSSFRVYYRGDKLEILLLLPITPKSLQIPIITDKRERTQTPTIDWFFDILYVKRGRMLEHPVPL
jgi:hypothetical protein